MTLYIGAKIFYHFYKQEGYYDGSFIDYLTEIYTDFYYNDYYLTSNGPALTERELFIGQAFNFDDVTVWSIIV
jgi:hypothetical protein